MAGLFGRVLYHFRIRSEEWRSIFDFYHMTKKTTDTAHPAKIPVVTYVRMSTEHQQYSTSNQMDVIKEYAAKNNMEIVHTYSDEGKSGLNIKGREALRRMIQDVQSGNVNFQAILVYDVSRWGRFQDPDESAHYEYICRKVGIAFHYCAEQFVNDGSMGSAALKSIKRSMAGEYSRELSSKVFRGACRLIKLGFKQGGTAGYGLRRMLIDHNGQQKGMLKMGEHKSIQTDRVILVPGPDEEVKTVRLMFEQFVNHGRTESQIATALNNQEILTDFNRQWTRGTVHEVLTNEKYIGNNVYCRTSFKLKQKHVINPPDEWVRAEGAFEAIVPKDQFFTAHGIILARSHRLTDDEMLQKLRELLGKRGHISGLIIDEDEGMPSSTVFRSRFGSLLKAYQMIGYDPDIDYSFIEINRHLRKMSPEFVVSTIAKIRELGATVIQDSKSGLLRVNDEINVSIVLCRHQTTDAGFSRWVIRLEEGLKPDITVAVRMAATNQEIKDYYILPRIDMDWDRIRIAEQNGVGLDTYRTDSLDLFLSLTQRIAFEDLV